MITIEKFREYVERERRAQLSKWGIQRHSDQKWYLIGSEEWGEVAKAILENEPDEMICELVQMVAVIETWIESIED